MTAEQKLIERIMTVAEQAGEPDCKSCKKSTQMQQTCARCGKITFVDWRSVALAVIAELTLDLSLFVPREEVDEMIEQMNFDAKCEAEERDAKSGD